MSKWGWYPYPGLGSVYTDRPCPAWKWVAVYIWFFAVWPVPLVPAVVLLVLLKLIGEG